MNQKWKIYGKTQVIQLDEYALSVTEITSGKFFWKVTYNGQVIAHSAKLFFLNNMKYAKEVCMKRMNEHKRITNAV